MKTHITYIAFILFILFLYFEDVNTSNFTRNIEVYSEDFNSINITKASQAFDDFINCTIAFEDEKSGKKKMNSTVKVVHIITKFRNGTEKILSEDFKKSEIFKALEWIRVSGKYGEGILQLKPNYEILSLQSLTIQKEEIELKLKETPSGCMAQLSATEYQDKMRTFLLQYVSSERYEEICNIHIKDQSGQAVFYYECCSTDDHHEKMKCHRVRKNDWVTLIDILTYICIMLAIMYFPVLIPTSLYSNQRHPSSFVHVLQRPFRIFVNKKEFSKHKGKKFFQKSKNDPLEDELGHKFEKLYLKIDHEQLVSENSAPISLTRMMYEAIKPKDNYTVSTQEGESNKKDKLDFLKASMLGPIRFCGRKLKWGTCVYYVSLLLLSVIVVSPWIFRMVVYYFYEKEIRLRRQKAAEERNLEEHFGVNLTYFFGPVHGLFLICYALLCVDLIMFSMLRKEVKNMLQQTFLPSLANMHNISRKYVLHCAGYILLLPLTTFGIFGIIFWIPLLPLVIIMLTFLILPALSLGSTLLWKFLRYIFPEISDETENRLIKTFKMEKVLHSGSSNRKPTSVSKYKNITPLLTDVAVNTMSVPVPETSKQDHIWKQLQEKPKCVCKRILRIFLVLTALTTIISFVLLVVECIIFLFEVAVYTLIGLVLNSSHAVQYLTAVTLVWFYFFNCFNGISTKYLNFNKAIHKILLSENKEQVVEVAKAPSEDQDNTAFKVCHAKNKVPELEIHGGTPKWSTCGVVLLMDKYDQLYMNKRFFFKASVLDHPHCPGGLFENFMASLSRFICILIFLLFVTFVVLAFGDTYEISISNQLLATCAGGIVPLLIQKSKVIFSKQEEPDADQLQENISFMAKFHTLIESSNELWNIGSKQFIPGIQNKYGFYEHDNPETNSTSNGKMNNNAGQSDNPNASALYSTHGESIVKTMPTNGIAHVTISDINVQID